MRVSASIGMWEGWSHLTDIVDMVSAVACACRAPWADLLAPKFEKSTRLQVMADVGRAETTSARVTPSGAMGVDLWEDENEEATHSGRDEDLERESRSRREQVSRRPPPNPPPTRTPKPNAFPMKPPPSRPDV